MKKIICLLSALFLILYAGCSNNSTGPSSGTDAHLKISMVDSPADFDSVNIVVTRVEVHMAGDSTSWMVVNSISHTYNLLDLRNGASVVIGDTFLTAGHYTQIRLIIGEGSYVVVDGISYPVTIPSGMQTGIKLNHEFDLTAGNLYELLLDFDAEHSIHLNGNGQYIMNPVIRVTAVVTSGSISGQVLPLDANATVSTVVGTDTVSTNPNTEGFFKLMTLLSGVYSVHIIPANIAYKDTTISNVNVTAGNDTNIGVIILSPQ